LQEIKDEYELDIRADWDAFPIENCDFMWLIDRIETLEKRIAILEAPPKQHELDF
jgi:hypothetical protein